MRRWTLLALGGALVGCAQRAPAKIGGDGQLVLELGGTNKSLSTSLVGLGVDLLPPREPPVVHPTPTPGPIDAGGGNGDGEHAVALGPTGRGDDPARATAPGVAKEGVAKDGVAKDGVAQDGVAKDGVAHDGVAKDGVAKDGVARDGVAKDGGGTTSWFEVELAPRQTLMDLAHKHLGSGLRFKELLALNGMTEKDARRLKVGQKIRIPKAAPR